MRIPPEKVLAIILELSGGGGHTSADGAAPTLWGGSGTEMRRKTIEGDLRGGEGFYSDDSGEETCCTPQEDYTFDAPVPR